MAKLPNMSLADRIDSIDVTPSRRGYIGASSIGATCTRSLAYKFYWTHDHNTVPARLNRIFRLGDAIENLIVASLKTIGIEIAEDQRQVKGPHPYILGHIDGLAFNVPRFNEPLLFEAKSMNHTNFLDMKRKGVQESKPSHYTQMQMYMGRLDLRFGLYVAYNKNDSSLYTEILPFDLDWFRSHEEKEQAILGLQHINELPRVSDNPSWFVCKACTAKSICHQGAGVERNCRTCEHFHIVDDGAACALHDYNLDLDKQEQGCISYELGNKWL